MVPSVTALASGAMCPSLIPPFRPAPPLLQGIDWPMALLVVLLLLALLLGLLLIMLRPIPWRLRLPGGAWGASSTAGDGQIS